MTKKDTALLKGLGILLIITHNYMHWLPDCVAENEYTFSVSRIEQLAAYLAQGGPHVLLNTLSHFGHYGVAIFLFISGYGLVKKYEQSLTPSRRGDSVIAFLLRHAAKLWCLLLPALLLFVATELLLGTWNRPFSRLLPLVGFYSNLMPRRDLILGPWWWFGLMMQFYLLWRLLIYRRGRLMLYTLMGLCAAAVLVMAWVERGELASTDTITCYLHYNFPPSMLAFGLGVADARYGLKWLHRWWSPLVGVTIIAVGCFNAGIWSVSSVGALMIALALVGKESDEPQPNDVVYINLRMVLIFLGGISAWLFALHPVVRAYTIDLAKMGSDRLLYLSIVVYLAASIALAWAATALCSQRHRRRKDA